MELALITVNKVIEMFLILLLGVVLLKTGVSDHGTSKKLSAILLYAISPCMLIMSYQIAFEETLLRGLLVTAGLSVVSLLCSILLSNFLIRSKGNPNVAVERMSIVYSNCGFMGIPLIHGILGSEGVFFISVYILVFNVLIWTHGLMMMGGRVSGLGATVRNLVQPATVAIAVSLFLFLNGIRLPQVVAEPMQMVADMNTPVAMLVAGMNLAESDILGCLKRPRTYLITGMKLIVVPIITLGILSLVHVERNIALTVLVASACPSAAMSAMFALQYHKDSKYATELFTITTILSLLTVPIVVLAGSIVF